MIEFNKKVEPNIENVALYEIENDTTSSNAKGFVFSEDVAQNNKLGLYKVISLGKVAADKTGLVVGDYVFADRLSSFYHTSPVAVMNYKNIIAKTTEKHNEYFPLKGYALVEKIPDENKSLFYTGEQFEIQKGLIKKITLDDSSKELLSFKEGDLIMLTREGDCVNVNLWLYKVENIIAKILPEDVKNEAK